MRFGLQRMARGLEALGHPERGAPILHVAGTNGKGSTCAMAAAALGALENFILPGGSAGAAHLHVARTVCRRAERLAVSLAREERIGPFVIAYLNRLSDALFVMARWENKHRGIEDVTWNSRI
jgi:cob(I)alamin adenosyltransferase